AVSPGTAVVTVASRENADVKATIVVTVAAPDYPVIELDRQLGDTEGWTAADAVKFGEGTVRIFGDGVFGYGGEKFGSGLITFKAKFDDFNTGWYGFALRSVRTGDPTWVNGNQGYLVVIKEDMIEFQTWKPGQTMVDIIPNTSVLPNQEHLIEIGAINVEGGVRFILKVDGKAVLNVLDTDPANPIPSEGYLNVYNYAGAEDAIELKPSRKPDPGTGTGPIVTPKPEPDEELVVVRESDLTSGSGDGILAFELEPGQHGVILSQEILKLLEHPIEVRSGELKLTFEPELLRKLAEEQPRNAKLAIKMVPLTKENVASKPSASYKMVGVPYRLELLALVDGEEPRYISDFPEPIPLAYTVKPSGVDVNEEWLGIYYENQAGKWEYVGGEFDPASQTLSAELPHFSVYAVMEYEAAFADMPSGHWANGAVKALAARHIVTGKSEDRFDPDGTTTRAEFVALLVRTLGLQSEGTAELPFRDVRPSDWHAEVIAAAYEAKLVSGRQEDVFAPNERITREEMAVMLLRAYAYASGKSRVEAGASGPKDLTAASQWARTPISEVVGLGLMTGYPDGEFKPKRLADRDETAQVVYNLLKLL
ncbi:hypothetical protein PAT3040_04451, partial [Paenibacillus agaridevorans]